MKLTFDMNDLPPVSPEVDYRTSQDFDKLAEGRLTSSDRIRFDDDR